MVLQPLGAKIWISDATSNAKPIDKRSTATCCNVDYSSYMPFILLDKPNCIDLVPQQKARQ